MMTDNPISRSTFGLSEAQCFVLVERQDDLIVLQEDGVEVPNAETVMVTAGLIFLDSSSLTPIKECTVYFEDGSVEDYYINLEQKQIIHLTLKNPVLLMYKMKNDTRTRN